MNCPSCDRDPGWNGPQCQHCGGFVGYPNVRRAQRENEVQALGDRRRDAQSNARARFVEGKLETLQNLVGQDAKIVITMCPTVALNIINETGLYAAGPEAWGITIPAPSQENQQTRKLVDVAWFGAHCDDIKFGALSPGASGVWNYGSVAVTVVCEMVERRTSLSETNTFKIWVSHGVTMPPGLRAEWSKRDLLAAIKLEPEINVQNTAEAVFQDNLLINGGNRDEDEFVEVHIAGPSLTFAAVAAVEVKDVRRPPVSSADSLIVEVLSSICQEKGIPFSRT